MRLRVAVAHPPEEIAVTFLDAAGRPIVVPVPPMQALVTCIVLDELKRRELVVQLPIDEWQRVWDALVAGDDYIVETASPDEAPSAS